MRKDSGTQAKKLKELEMQIQARSMAIHGDPICRFGSLGGIIFVLCFKDDVILRQVQPPVSQRPRKQKELEFSVFESCCWSSLISGK